MSPTIHTGILYSLNQMPFSISRRTAGSAEQNGRRSQIVAAPRLLFKKHVAREHASRLILDGRYKKSNDKDLVIF